MNSIIPIPEKYVEKQGEFVFTNEICIKSDFDLPLLNCENCESAQLIIKNNNSIKSEGYILSVNSENIIIESSDEAGAYYALQSLRQLSRYELGERRVKCCKIEDSPRFRWRGLQLDCSRHFWSVDEIKKLLDHMFMMKLNVFHWHLTDDQGWRIEIKKYPRLTEIGSVRKYTHINGWNSKEIINEQYSGYYSQAQIIDIVEYAAARSIMIVPEIDFPAHSASSIASYKWLACRELDSEVPGYFGGIIPEKVYGIKDWNRTICLGKEKTINFVFDVIDEVCELFPAPYFHIGGDEAPTDEWEKCPNCQKVIRENKLGGEENLQGWFNNRVLEHLKSKGKQLIGWNEILKAGNLDKSIVAQYWTPSRDKNVERFAREGGRIIMSKHQSFYFDMPYGKYPLSNTYNFKPEDYGIDSDGLNNILGVEGELWTEWIDTQERLEMMMCPRAQALSEVAWSPQDKRDFNDFKVRLDSFKPFYNHLGINYATDKVSQPEGRFRRLQIEKKFMKGDVHLEDKLNLKYMSKEKNK